MPKTVADMTVDELRELIDDTIEGKLVELFGDPDEGQELSQALRERLIRQHKAVSEGERGEDFNEVVRRLSLS